MIGHAVLRRDLEPGLDVVFGIDAACETPVGVLVGLDDTVVAGVVERDIDVALVVAVLEVDAVLLHEAGLEELVAPVDVGAVPFPGKAFADTAALQVVGEVLVGVHHLGLATQALDGELCIVADPADAFGLGATLGGDEDHTVACLSSVDGSRSGILQYLHRLDVGGVDVDNRIDAHAIDYIKRVGS